MPRASISLFFFQTVLYYEWYLLIIFALSSSGTINSRSLSPFFTYSVCPDSKFSAFFTEVEDQIAEFASSLDEQNRLLHCQLERALVIISTTIGRLFPTEILSLALGRPSFGIASGDVLTELNCFRIVGRVLPSLALDDVKNIPCCTWSNFCIPKLVYSVQASLLARILSSKASQLPTKIIILVELLFLE